MPKASRARRRRRRWSGVWGGTVPLPQRLDMGMGKFYSLKCYILAQSNETGRFSITFPVKVCNIYSIAAMGYFLFCYTRLDRENLSWKRTQLLTGSRTNLPSVWPLKHSGPNKTQKIRRLCRRCPCCSQNMTRNSSGDEIANVNFLYDDIVHVLQNTIDSCINSATDRRGYVLERMCLPNSVK